MAEPIDFIEQGKSDKLDFQPKTIGLEEDIAGKTLLGVGNILENDLEIINVSELVYWKERMIEKKGLKVGMGDSGNSIVFFGLMGAVTQISGGGTKQSTGVITNNCILAGDDGQLIEIKLSDCNAKVVHCDKKGKILYAVATEGQVLKTINGIDISSYNAQMVILNNEGNIKSLYNPKGLSYPIDNKSYGIGNTETITQIIFDDQGNITKIYNDK